jgi:glucan phosphoethanolaminetransferase (alkaline phosphatase superfamily)
MFNLNVIPNVNEIDSQETNANGGLIAQLIIFYIGVVAFILVCCIPPFTLFIPFLIPMILIVVVFVNLAYFGKFLDRAGKKFQSLVDNTKNMTTSTTDSLSSNLENRVESAEDGFTSDTDNATSTV